MYVPNAFRENDRTTLLAFMRAHSFATLVSVIDGAPFASHVPLLVTERNDHVILTGHLARTNPHCAALATGPALAIFTGPHAYVSPTLYEQVQNVPTWNYIAVHASGHARVLDATQDQAELERLMAALVEYYEASYQTQWDSLPQKYRDGMLHGVVGFEIVVTGLEGKAKLSQNRSHTDQHTVAAALSTSADPAAAATGVLMQTRIEGRSHAHS